MEDILKLQEKLDTKNMYEMIASMASHLEEGLFIGEKTDLGEFESVCFSSVVVCGMGGSAIGGDLARTYLSKTIPIPFTVERHYKLPEFVNKKTLVICSSYSGNTEETLSGYDEAMEKGARVVVITTGGKLAEKAKLDGVPCAKIKGGFPPRAALGYSFAPLLKILSRLGLCESPDEKIKKTAQTLRKQVSLYAPENKDNSALKLAEEIHGTIPIIYSGYERMDAVATRFKGQICENGKALAFVNVFPEFNHNELVGWNKLYGLDKNLVVLILEDKDDHSRVKVRMKIVSDYLKRMGIKVFVLESEGETDLERMFYFIQLADFTSYYLALLNDVDPSPVAVIDYLKKKLAEIG